MGSDRPAARTQQKLTCRDHLAKIRCRHLWKEYVKTGKGLLLRRLEFYSTVHKNCGNAVLNDFPALPSVIPLAMTRATRLARFFFCAHLISQLKRSTDFLEYSAVIGAAKQVARNITQCNSIPATCLANGETR